MYGGKHPPLKFPASSGGDISRQQMQHQLHTISSCMQDLEEQCPDFIDNLKKWVLHRHKTIRVLQKTARDLDDTHRNSNVAQCIGDGLAILGGIGEIVGLFMEHNSSDNAGKVKEFGKTLGNIGAATSFGTQWVEKGLSWMKVDEVKEMLKEDEDLLREIAPWLERSKSMNDAIAAVFKIGFTTSFEIKGNITIFKIIESFSEGRKTPLEVTADLVNAGYESASVHFKHFAKNTLPMILDKLDEIFNDSKLYQSFRPIVNMLVELPRMIEDNNYLLAAQSCLKVFPGITNRIGGSSVMGMLPIASIANRVVDQISSDSRLQIVAKSVIVAKRFDALMSTGDELMKCTPSQYSENLRNVREHMIQELNRIVEEFEKYFEKNSRSRFQLEYK